MRTTAARTGSLPSASSRQSLLSGAAPGRRREILRRSGKADYVSGSLGQSEVLRGLTAEETDILGLDADESMTAVQDGESVEEEAEVTVHYLDDDMDDTSDMFGLDEGWTAESDEAPVLEQPEVKSATWKGQGEIYADRVEEEKLFDLRSDPVFSHLPMKSVMNIEREIERDRQRQKKDMDESSLATRTQGAPHRKLRIVGGALKGRRLLSPRGRFVRPMMERVRAAIFDMLFAGSQGFGIFPQGTRWLDLYAGTGAVGLEAMSRGCEDVHFVEMDPWVVSNVLRRNVDECDCTQKSTIRTMTVEHYLDTLIRMPQYRSGPFDFVTVCPPYKQVSYPELQQQLEDSGVLHNRSIVFMEYPRQLSRQIRDSLGGLKKIRDRPYGRTYLAVYGNGSD